MRTPKEPAFKFELLPLHSPLLGQSLLVSFPPLIDMLKFSGYPYLIRGQPEKKIVSSAKAPAGPTERVTKPHTLEDRTRCRRCLSGPSPAEGGTRPNTQAGLEGSNDARTGMPPGIPGGAMCVQRLDDSLNSAIHINYRISLRSSSMPEPRDPLLKVLTNLANRSDCKLQTAFKGVSGRRGPGGEKPPGGREAGLPKQQGTINTGGRLDPEGPHSVMILPQVHLRKPCYDFYFL
ncbi:hypothetical protein N7493_009320 [Penicillium malachiteum]|uniref:Uncharacterized protein n=1 Tax=Penicillium malachiteum TaxID=1324776 RepID=A0AAD6HEY4_9EURO|nr:hypothetical protein N7493_009320 [Penicillium malachiteum]